MNLYVNSKDVIDRIKELKGLLHKEIASEVFNISENNLSNKIRNDKLNFYQLFEWAINEGVNLNWLITGQGEKYVLEASKSPESGIMKEPISEHGQSGKKLILDLLDDEDIKKGLAGLLADVFQNIAAKLDDNETKLKKIEKIISNACQPPEGIQERRRCRGSIDKILYNINQS